MPSKRFSLPARRPALGCWGLSRRPKPGPLVSQHGDRATARTLPRHPCQQRTTNSRMNGHTSHTGERTDERTERTRDSAGTLCPAAAGAGHGAARSRQPWRSPPVTRTRPRSRRSRPPKTERSIAGSRPRRRCDHGAHASLGSRPLVALPLPITSCSGLRSACQPHGCANPTDVRWLHRPKSTAMTARRCAPQRSSPSRTSPTRERMMHGSRCPSTDVSEAAARAGHAGGARACCRRWRTGPTRWDCPGGGSPRP